ncbi:fibronectin type III domain-containing protein [Flavobacterium terrigena]|uniref:Por secretion system C-terminal sorting domain-containing protein n=1 Tax=Flavobacterium terrigena TaxID=402734 RepID=A0A1H6XL33_9FLAO|nr:fibronectin type III domain-containing protein [Flavobacterium terrigena]SEJ25560.1 Por secretion system C-terminal sorting domain-containing protein [Flavobacterium terrigena]
MKKTLRLILILLLSNIAFSQTATFDISGNLTINGISGMWWSYKYKPTGTSTYTQGPQIQNSSSAVIKLSPFISWDVNIGYYNISGGGYIWGSDYTTNSAYANIAPKTTGYNFNFDTSALDEGWRGYRLQNTTALNNSNIAESTYITFGNVGKSVYCGWQSGYGLMLVSPKISDLATDKKFSIYGNSYQGNYSIVLGTMSDPYDQTTFHPLKTVTLQGPSFQKVEVFMNNYTGSDNYIAIKTNGNGGDIYFDNFSYEQSVNCFDNTNLTVTNVNQDNATINFNADVAQNSWEINLKNVTNGIIETFTVNSSTYVLQNLTGNTSYEVKVRANCAPNLYSNWTPIQAFSTVCSQISAGYETSFLEKPYIDPCWKLINNGINQAPYGGNTNVNPRTGSKYIRIQQNSTNQANYLITPYINDLDTNKRIKFYLVSDGNGDYIDNTLTIGTMSNPNDAATFVPIKTISPLEMNEVNGFKVNNYWKEHIVYFDNYNTSLNHKYIAIRGDITQYNSIFHIDDFKYENTPICKEPVNLQNEKITYNSAVVKWENYNNINTGEWEIQYGISGFTIGSGTTITTTTNPTTLINLLPDTNYDFYVRTKCGTNYSNWSDRGTFKSKCEGFTVGYTDNFESGNFDTNTCWSRLTAPIREDYFSADSQVSYVTAQPHTGAKSIRLYHTTAYHVLNDISKKILVSPRFADLNNERIISFWGYLASTTVNAIQIGTLSDPNDYLTFTPYKNITTNLTINQWNKYVVDFSEYYGTDKFIGIKVINTNSNNIVLYIDDFEYLLNDCTKPSALTATQTDSNSVLLNWNTNNNNPINCEIEYGPIGFTSGTGTLATTTSKPFTLSGLTSNTNYQFRVRNICSGTINWSEPYSLKTSCYVTSPFNENFDQYTATNYSYIPNFCWTFNENMNENMYCGVADRSINNYTSPPNVAYITNGSTEKDVYLISPFLSDFDNTKKIKFWIFGTNKPITVGTISNPLDINTFEAFQEIQLTDILQTGKEILVDFSSYTGSNKMIAIKINKKIGTYTTTQSVSIDDFKYSTINSCKEPINVQFSKITNNSTVIKWDNLNGGNVQIEYGIQGFAIGSGQIVTTTQNEILISGLNESSTYDFYFHTICGGNNSDLVGPKKIKTTCQPYSIPWLEDFNQLSAYGTNILPTCMNVIAPGFISKNTNQIVYSNSFYNPDHLLTGNGDTSYIWCNSNGKPSITSPPFNLIAGVCYKFNIDARKSYEYDSQGISISVGKGNETHYMESSLSRSGVLSEYNYNTNSFLYTPIENGTFTFIISGTSGSATSNMIMDNFNLIEGYSNIIGYPVIYNNNFTNNELILEKATNSNIIQTTISGDLKLKMNGGLTAIENFDGSDWRKNQSSISKINFKINAPTINPLVLKFDLKQTFNTNNNESLFRVVVNGNQVGNVIMPATNNSDGYLTHEFDLSAYANDDVYISLQHIGKSSSGTGDNAIIDNIEITNFLSSEEFSFKNLKVYPNPTKDLININNYEVINSYEITNISGQAIEKKSIEMNDFKINIDKFPSGIYLLKLNSENNSKTVKIVKE